MVAQLILMVQTPYLMALYLWIIPHLPVAVLYMRQTQMQNL